MILKIDCRHFPGNQPCLFHKENGIKCEGCQHYSPIGYKVLFVKLGAAGDVLRTTPLLIELKERYPNMHVTWIVDKGPAQVLEGNTYIDRVWIRSAETNVNLLPESFDLLLSLDNDIVSATVASIAKADQRKGFGLDQRGFVVPYDEKAEKWLEMAAFDDVKRANTRTYQSIIFEMCGLSFQPQKHEIILPDFSEEIAFSQGFARQHGLMGVSIIGLNTGAGGRWESKRWGIENFIELAHGISKELSGTIMLLGGPEEVERNEIIGRALQQKGVPFVDSGCKNALNRFIALLQLCDVIVSGDTMAMHLAIGLKKPVVALFGPTSAAEIEIYGRGEKLIAQEPCSCFYRPHCKSEVSCMNSITADMGVHAVKSLINPSATRLQGKENKG